ncbi:MAG TPA: hypothetical protein VF198_12200 [Vicinamibacterales bacterium]
MPIADFGFVADSVSAFGRLQLRILSDWAALIVAPPLRILAD